ncbi:MAG: hypothetical protein ACFFA3_19835 [Promethearchaeota archaeon]
MAYFRRKEKDIIKLGREYLIWGLILTIFGVVFTILVYSSLKPSLEEFLVYSSLKVLKDLAGLIIYVAIIMIYLFGVIYFFMGVSKLKKLFKEISNIGFYYGIISYILSIPFSLYGCLSPIICYYFICRWHPPLTQEIIDNTHEIILYLGIFMFISSIITFFLELRKTKGEIFEKFISKQVEVNAIKPLSTTLYKIRIEENYKVCGNCKEKNRFETLNEKKGLFRCLKCNSENYLDI